MDDLWGERRSSTVNGQFPSKFGTLPRIGSPQPNAENQMVPFGGMQSRMGGLRNSNEGLEPEERIRQLETRLNVAEKSNRALLEEVVRLQSELKANVRKNDDMLREERQARTQMENSLRASNDLMAQLSSRLKKNEEKVVEERSTVSALVNHTKSVEQAVLGSQQELMSRRDQQSSRIQELQQELDNTSRAKDTLERLVYNMVDEVRQIKGKVDSQTMDLNSAVNDVKGRAKKLEDETRQARLENQRKQGETASQSEQTIAQLRNQVEARLSELRDVLVDLRNKQDQETQERRITEQTSQLKLGDLSAGLSEQTRKREEAMHALEVVQREREHAAETERIRLQSKIAEIAEEVSKKILQKEMKLREETSDKFKDLEKLLRSEQQARQDHEQQTRVENEKRWDSLKKLSDEEVAALKESALVDRAKVNSTLHKLDDAVNLLDKQLEQQKKEADKVLEAEVKSRKQQENKIKGDMDDLQQKIALATATLQSAIGGMNSQTNGQLDQMKKEIKAMLGDTQEAGTRSLVDMDARLMGLNERISRSEDMLQARIGAQKDDGEAQAANAQNLREKVESISLWQSVTQQSIKDLQARLQTLPQEVYELEEKLKLLKEDVKSRSSAESESRIEDVKRLENDIEILKGPKPDDGGPRASDLEACQSSVRKLAESIQTVKTVLGMKIQSEQKLRTEEVKNLNDDVIRLRALIEPLVQRNPEPKIFIKPDGVQDPKKAEKESLAINKWSMYTAYRWLIWKQKWLYVKWAKQHSNNNSPAKQEDPKKNDPKTDDPPKDDPKKDEPNKDDPKKDEPKKDDPPKDEPQKDDAKKDEPKKDDNKTDPPKNDNDNKNDGKGPDW